MDNVLYILQMPVNTIFKWFLNHEWILNIQGSNYVYPNLNIMQYILYQETA